MIWLSNHFEINRPQLEIQLSKIKFIWNSNLLFGRGFLGRSYLALAFFPHLQIPSITSEGRSAWKMFFGLETKSMKNGMIPCWGLLIKLVTSGARINKQQVKINIYSPVMIHFTTKIQYLQTNNLLLIF